MLAFARQIEGGFSIVSPGAEEYVVSGDCPEQCTKTGLPVILFEEGNLRIKRILAKKNELLDVMGSQIRAATEQILNGCEEVYSQVEMDPDNLELREDYLARVFAMAGISRYTFHCLKPFHENQDEVTQAAESMLEKLNVRQAEAAGVIKKVNHEMVNPVAELLDLMFGLKRA